jgi:hypothetical protein
VKFKSNLLHKITGFIFLIAGIISKESILFILGISFIAIGSTLEKKRKKRVKG